MYRAPSRGAKPTSTPKMSRMLAPSSASWGGLGPIDGPIPQEHGLVGVHNGQIQVVKDGDHRDAPAGAERLDDLHGLLLEAHIQVAGGLVQQHDPGALGHRPGDKHPLALPAGELVELTHGVPGQVHGLQHLPGDVVVLALQPSLSVRHPPGEHGFQHVEAASARLGVLGHIADESGPFSGGEAPQVGVVGEHPARLGPEDAVDALEQGGLSRAVGAQQGAEGAGGHLQVHPPEHLPLFVAETQALYGDLHSTRSFRSRRMR